VTATRRDQLVGNRLALVGTVLYFMEWIGIAALGASLPTDRLGDRPAETVADYAHHPARTALLAGWLSFVLLGRVLFTIGLRDAFRDRRRELPLATFAVAAMTVSVAIEVINYALVASGAWLAKAHGNAGAIVALDAAGTVLFAMIWAPIGVSMIAASLAMLRSRLFPTWLSWLGLVSGALVVCGGVIGASALGSSGVYHTLGGILNGVPGFGFWIWMIATAIVLFRATPGPGPAAATAG
jgi:uncharacterized protein DUF4386